MNKPNAMFRTLSTLLFQSLVFGCLLVFLSLGSMEILEDGRVVVTLGDYDTIIVAEATVQSGDTIYLLSEPEHDIKVKASLIGIETVTNPSFLVWIWNHVPCAKRIMPNRLCSADYRRYRIAVSLDQMNHLREIQEQLLLCSMHKFPNPPTHQPQSEKAK